MSTTGRENDAGLVDELDRSHRAEEAAVAGGQTVGDHPAGSPTPAVVTTGPVDDARRPRRRRPVGSLAVSALSVTVFLCGWQLAAVFGWINPLFTSSPTGIGEALVELVREGELTEHLVASGRLFGLGFALSVVFALPAGILLGWYSRLAAVFDPFLQTLYVAPRIALIPVIFTWFGVGLQSQVVIVFITAFFPLLINTVSGVRAIDPSLLRVARSFMARDRDVFWTLALPSALPFIVSGLRLSMGMALIGVVVAEFFTGNVGLGALITTAGLSLQTDVAFVGVLVVTAFALLLNALLTRLEARVSAWKVVP
ncbi:ABC transporter permease [Geodermatophilus sp. DSM 44513]|uniref:ABC transporter permease n=1 Tax=Geodermatophilus sp. DSM 44513 TaxID=1528104 RepID=UPI00126CCA6D|nr:ABC transporter permease [Geodermatophilus sp. DSM 44513]WNV77091.1 ABC transporter permease [Geodermatophilus sp. DSM 44513]